MARILPSNLTDPTPNSILGSDQADPIRRDIRRIIHNPQKDRVAVDVVINGDDVEVFYEIVRDLGVDTVFEVVDKANNVITSNTVTDTDGSFTFSNLPDKSAKIFAYNRNSSGVRVSLRFEFQIQINGPAVHPDKPSFADAQSDYELTLGNISRLILERDDLKDLADRVKDVFLGHHNKIQDVEEHIDVIWGLSTTYSDNPLTVTNVEEAAKPQVSRLFPQSNRGIEPIRPNWVDPHPVDESGYSTIFTYSSAERSPGDPPEWKDLEDAKADVSATGTVTVDIWNETEQQFVTYNDDSELQARQDEIEQIVSDFNSNSPYEKLYDDRFFWIRRLVQRVFGYRYRQILNTQGIEAQQGRLELVDKTENKMTI